MKEEFQFVLSEMVRKAVWKTSRSIRLMRKRRNIQQKIMQFLSRKGDARVSKNGQGVFVQTATNATVESVNEGSVVLQAKRGTW